MTGFEFHPGPSPQFNMWRDSTGSKIRPQSSVRLRVIGRKWDSVGRAYTAAGSLNGDLLGARIVDDPAEDNDF